MEPNINSPTLVGFASNGGSKPYRFCIESGTGFVACRNADGDTIIIGGGEVKIPPTPAITFWSCASQTDATACGGITALDCPGNQLGLLEIAALLDLQHLNCGFNRLTKLNVPGADQTKNTHLHQKRNRDAQSYRFGIAP